MVEPNQGAQVVEQIEDADFLVTYRSGRVPESILPHAKQLKLIQVKRIAGAGIDVFDPEPPDPKNSLLHMDNVIATPHMGGTSWENWELGVKNVWNNVQRVWEGEEPKNQVREF